MSIAKIHGSEYPIRKIFCNDFLFQIPLYQRLYAWTTEQANELLDDLLGFIGTDDGSIDELSPYFLGRIVLIKQDNIPEAEIVDGQQRLTTLTIPLSALRSFLTGGLAASITKYLYQKGDELEGTPIRYRQSLRERDAQFFRQYIQDDGQIGKLRALDPRQLTDSQRNNRANTLLFLEKLGSITQEEEIRLAQCRPRRSPTPRPGSRGQGRRSGRVRPMAGEVASSHMCSRRERRGGRHPIDARHSKGSSRHACDNAPLRT